MVDIDDSLARNADSLLLTELKHLRSVQFDEVLLQLMNEIRLEPRKVRNKATYYYAETVSMQDQKRVILFVTKRDGALGASDVESLSNHAEKVRAPRAILMTMGEVSREAEREGQRRGIQVINGSELATLIRKSGLEDMILKDFALESVVAPAGEETLEEQLVLGVELLKAGDFVRALEHFDRAISSDPASEIAWRLKGEVLDQLGHHGKALGCYTRALELSPDNPEVWYLIGTCMYSLGRYDEELQCYEKALDIEPRFEKALVNRGATLLKLKKFEEALSSYDKAIKLNYRLVKAHNNRGIALRHLNRLEEAVDAFESALGLDPEFADAWLNRAAVLRELERPDQALQSLEHVVVIHPDDKHAWKMKGEIESDLGNPREAIKSFEKAIEIDPTNNEIRKILDREKLKVHEAHEEVPEMIGSIFSKAGIKYTPTPIFYAETPEAEPELPPAPEVVEPVAEEPAEEPITEEPVSEEPLVEEPVTEETLVEEAVPAEPAPEEPITEEPVTEEAPSTPESEVSELKEAPIELVEEGPEPIEVEVAEIEAEEPEEPEEGAEGVVLPLTTEEELLFEEEIGEPPSGVAEEVFGDAAELMIYMRRPEVALTELDKGLRLEPMSVRMYLLKGRALYMLGRTDDAISSFRKAAELDPQNEEAIYSMEYLLNSIADHSGVEAALKPLLNGKNWIAEVLAAMNADTIGKINKVSEHMEAAISLEPSAIAWNFKGLLDLEMGDFESAIDAFSHAHEQEVIFSDPTNNEGVSYLKLGVRAEASMHFDVAISFHPRNSAAWNNRGVMLYSFDRHEEALACFDEALIYGRNPYILINRGFTLLAIDSLPEALKAFEESLSLLETPEGYNDKGIALVRMNRTEDAINCFEAALQLDHAFEDAKRNLKRYQPEEIRLISKEPEKVKAEEGLQTTPLSMDDIFFQLENVSESSLNKKRKKELQDICTMLGLSKSGMKSELIERILAARSAREL